MTQTITFNTGRQYTAQGQRIKATLYPDNVVTFYDNDRMVYGQFDLPSWDKFDEKSVLYFYDRGFFEATAAAHADALHHGGMNKI